ncbi:oxygenase MpaB family protein [Actinoplanes sp. NPDC024001]|uniref:oxygenase MpaB family protein n=1 Tax=Actinoplanes sp. NPDC024001 TaxID=3154598 RepID=UPI0033C1133A
MDEGLFDDSAVIRRVAAEGLLLAGGGRATLLQIAHPGVAQGVFDHSSFAERPLDRLRTTMTYVYGVLYGTRDEAQTISRAVAAMHARVTGPGYQADDPDLQVWVNATLFDTAMLLYQRVLGPLPAAEADVCYRQYSVLATAIGCPESAWPADRATFARYWDRMIATLEVGDTGRRLANTLLWPEGLPVALRPAVPLNRFVTIGLLPEPIRAGFGYPWSPRRQKLLDRCLDGASAVYPRLPGRVRHAPRDLYLRDYRKRLARRRSRGSPGAGSRPAA